MMKKLTFLCALIISLSVFLSAQTSIDVEPLDGSGDVQYLNAFIEGNPGYDVYRLVSTTNTYYLNATLNVNASMKIEGVVNADDNNRKPTIQPLQQADGSELDILITCAANDVTLELENLYMFGKSNANARHAEITGVAITGDNIHTIANKCVFDEITQFVFSTAGKNSSFTITNNVIRNAHKEGNNPWVSELHRNLEPSNPHGDLIIRNNTMLGLNAYAACPNAGSANTKFVFDHNTVAYGVKNPLFIFMGTDVQVTNNIFYSTFCYAGNDASVSGAWDERWDNGVLPAVISFDTLATPNFDFSSFASDLSGNADSLALAEARRNVVIKNNAYFWPSEVIDFINTYNSTAAAEQQVVLPRWINDRTQNMFDDDTFWPGFELEGNVDADPGFPQAMKDIATNGFTAYLENCYLGGELQINYHFNPNEPDGTLEWQPFWPLEEDFSYTNETLKTAGTDGLPVGDLNWFPDITDVEDEAVVPTEFALQQNYPNPFNPSTKISYNIAETGNVSLKIYDVMGREVKTVVNSQQGAGAYNYTIDMSNMASGIYFYTLKHNNSVSTKKMMLLK